MKKSIGILGGMGPLATADLLRKIVLLTAADTDGGHVRVYVDDNPAIPDRTAAILSDGPDPVPAMTESLRKLEACGADCIVMPCNTAHYFLPRLQPLTPVPFLSMPEAAARACGDLFPGKRAGILATRGTLAAGIYQQALDVQGAHWTAPDSQSQDTLMDVIYNGVKAGRPPEAYRSQFLSVLERMPGADYFILGCTELPLAVQALGLTLPAVDPTEEIARTAIRFCGYPTHPRL